MPQEILQLSPDEEIVMVEGTRPIRAQKIRYFKEPEFKHRILPAAPVPKIDPMTPRVETLVDVEPATDEEVEDAMESPAEEEEISASH